MYLLTHTYAVFFRRDLKKLAEYYDFSIAQYPTQPIHHPPTPAKQNYKSFSFFDFTVYFILQGRLNSTGAITTITATWPSIAHPNTNIKKYVPNFSYIAFFRRDWIQLAQKL
jgi:hypothetical protein